MKFCFDLYLDDVLLILWQAVDIQTNQYIAISFVTYQTKLCSFTLITEIYLKQIMNAYSKAMKLESITFSSFYESKRQTGGKC